MEKLFQDYQARFIATNNTYMSEFLLLKNPGFLYSDKGCLLFKIDEKYYFRAAAIKQIELNDSGDETCIVTADGTYYVFGLIGQGVQNDEPESIHPGSIVMNDNEDYFLVCRSEEDDCFFLVNVENGLEEKYCCEDLEEILEDYKLVTMNDISEIVNSVLGSGASSVFSEDMNAQTEEYEQDLGKVINILENFLNKYRD